MERFKGLNQTESHECSSDRTDFYDGMLPSESGELGILSWNSVPEVFFLKMMFNMEAGLVWHTIPTEQKYQSGMVLKLMTLFGTRFFWIAS